MPTSSAPVPKIDTTRPHPARIYNYFLGGKDSYAVDRVAATRAEQVYPGIGHAARRNRAFLHRVGSYLAESGIRQYIDIGAGIPTEPNLHDIVWAQEPTARFVYVDRDPTVLAHASPFVKKSGGRAAYVNADIVQARKIMSQAAQHLDFGRPIALSIVAVWHFVGDDYQLPGSEVGKVYRPAEVMKELIAPLPAGSYIALSHVTTDFEPAQAQALAEVYREGGTPAQARSRKEILRLFAGLEFIEPGLVGVDQWHPESGDRSTEVKPVPVYAGLARKT